MFLSQLHPNIFNRQARYDLSSPYQMHRTIWRAMPEVNPGRVLFRLDLPSDGLPSVLVQSEFEPAWTRLAVLEQAGRPYLREPAQCKTFRPVFESHQRLHFRLRANPTKKISTCAKSERIIGNKDNGTRIGLLREVDQVQWLLDKAADGGFLIPGEWLKQDSQNKSSDFRISIVREGWVNCDKNDHANGRFLAVRFDGLLVVTDPQLFSQTLRQGIGPAKGFGFGLLSLAPAR